MMGVAGILRRKMSQKLLAKNDFLCFDAFTCRAGISTLGKNVGPNVNNDRVHATYSIYKGKAALSVRPVPPTFSRLDSGSLKVDRYGVMMLTFTPAVAERKYDWDKKQFFALSPTEAGSLISLSNTDSCEFFHDPSMKTSYSGQVRKNLSIKPSPGGSGYFFSLSVVNNVVQTSERFTVPVTPAEFAVLRTAFSYALPHIMGWDMYINQQSTGSKEIVHNKGAFGKASTDAFSTTDLEWEK